MQQTRNILKSWFETGDIPTQQQFADLIDSFFTYNDDTINMLSETTTRKFLTADERIAIARIFDYRCNSVSAASGLNTIVFSDPFLPDYLLQIECISLNSSKVGYQVTASDENGFTINVIVDCICSYTAIPKK